MMFALAAAVLVLWVRSYWQGYMITHHSGERVQELRVTCGALCIDGGDYQQVTRTWEFYSDPVDIMSHPRILHPEMTNYAATGYWELAIPMWMISVVSLLACACFRSRVRDATINCCPSCGYDLRASPDLCPECGKEVNVPPGKMPV